MYRPAAEADDMVYPVACVSLPRSGHHLLVRLLFGLYKRRFGYCAYYHRKDRPPECCGRFPCAQPRITMAKQHDFKLTEPVPTDRPIIVQYRRFDEAVVSNFELHARHHPDTAEEFRKFARRWAKVYSGFVTKWVEAPVTSRRLIIRYDRLTEHPAETMRELTSFLKDTRFDDRIPALVERIDHVSSSGGKPNVTKGAGVVNLRSVEGFRFYNRALFKRLNAVAYAGGPET